nr:ribonuclease H-like domain-containing protein [Tanacetum cinerariifolium]
MTHLRPHRHVVPTAVLTRSRLVPLTAARPVTTNVPQTKVQPQRPTKHGVTKAHSPLRRPINLRPSPTHCNFHQKVTIVRPTQVNVVQGIQVSYGLGSQKTLTFLFAVHGNPQHALKDKGVIDSRCSRHITGTISYLSDFEEINGGYVAFGGNPKGGKITDTECIVLSFDFKLPDDNHVLLRIPKENNMYNVDLKNTVPSGDLTCIFAKATLDESNLWHRRLGHIHFKTLNKQVKATKDETSTILKTFITGIENKINLKVKIIRSDNGTEFKNQELNQSCRIKGIKREFNVARTPQQNGITERKNRTLIKAARTMLADLLLPIPFWAEAVNTACYVQNRVLVTKPHNKIPYELLLCRIPSIGFMRPLGYHVTILNTLDHLENQPNVAWSGPTWLFDIDTLTQSMNYQPVVAGNQPNSSEGIQEHFDANKVGEGNVQQYVLFPLWSTGSKDPQNTDVDATFEVKKPESAVHVSPSSSDKPKKHDDKSTREAKRKIPVKLSTGVRNLSEEFEDFSSNNTNGINAASTSVTVVEPNSTSSNNTFSAAGPSNNVVTSNFELGILVDGRPEETGIKDLFGSEGNPQHALKDKGVIDSGCSRHMIGTISYLSDFEEINGGYVAFGGNPKDTECIVLSFDFKLPDDNHVLLRIPKENNMYNVDLKNTVPSGALTCIFSKATLDESNLWHRRLGHIHFKTMNKLVKGKFDGKADEGFLVGYSVSSKAFRVFNSRTRIVQETLHINFLENQPNVAWSGPTWLFDIDTLTQSMNYQPVVARNQPNSSAGIQEHFDANKVGEGNVQQYVLFPLWSTGSKDPQNTDVDATFEVKKPESAVHVSPSISDKPKKHDDKNGKSASTLIDTKKPLLKDPDGEDVDVHTYRSIIGSLMYLTSSKPDIMFTVCGKPHLGLWYPKDSPFNLMAYFDSDYAGASLDRKSTTGGCQFLGYRLISWQCKKQTVVATSPTEVEYVAAASCCTQDNKSSMKLLE